MVGQLLERAPNPCIDLALSGKAHDDGTISPVGYVEGFTLSFVMSAPRPSNYVISVGQDRAQRRLVVAIPEFCAVNASSNRAAHDSVQDRPSVVV
jgi:hypothetical protein